MSKFTQIMSSKCLNNLSGLFQSHQSKFHTKFVANAIHRLTIVAT